MNLWSKPSITTDAGQDSVIADICKPILNFKLNVCKNRQPNHLGGAADAKLSSRIGSMLLYCLHADFQFQRDGFIGEAV